MKKLLLLLSAILFTLNTFSQSSEGKEFWMGFLEHVNPSVNEMVIMITSKFNTTGKVTMPGKNWEEDFTVTANDVTFVRMPSSAETMGSEVIRNTGIKIETADPVTVYAHQYHMFRSEASLILPKESVGREYYVMTYTGFENQNGVYPSQFMVVGMEDETVVQITPAAQTRNSRAAQVPYTITLDAGETYVVQTKSGFSDMTGSHVVADKNIVVFGGATWTEVPSGCFARDNLYEQMHAVDTWGRKFIAVKSSNATRDILRIMAAEDNTKVWINNNLVATLSKGGYVQRDLLSQGDFIETSKAVMVMQYNLSSECNGLNGNTGDPSMMLLSAIEQTKDTVTLYSSRFEAITQNYIKVVIRSSDTSSLVLDGNPVVGSGKNFQVLAGNSDYAFITFSVGTGSHTLYSQGCGLIASAYGYGNYESYAYSGGANFRKINFNALPDGGCLNDTIFFSTGLPQDRFTTFWDFGDGTETDEFEPTHIYNQLGTYEMTLMVFDLCESTVDTFNKTLLVTLRDTILAGEDFEICAGDEVQLSSTDVGGAHYEWRGPNAYFSEEQNPLLTGTTADFTGFYSVVGIVSGCATYPATQWVDVRALPHPDLGNDSTMCGDGPVFLDAGDRVSYRWQDGSNFRDYTVTAPGSYWVDVTDDRGCVGTDTIHLEEYCLPQLFVPTGFTPNDDDINDLFKVSATFMISYEIQVFNRWGQLVFQTSNPDEFWNGSLPGGGPAGEGVYIWVVAYEWPGRDGFIYHRKESGTVTLIRY